MSQLGKTATLSLGGEGSEWAAGMPAYWLKLVAEPDTARDAELLTRFYYVKPTEAKAGLCYDQRLVVRVGGTEKAAMAAAEFALRYLLSMGHKASIRSIQTVSERMVRAWELAGRPGAV
jgi:hypothetical protein